MGTRGRVSLSGNSIFILEGGICMEEGKDEIRSRDRLIGGVAVGKSIRYTDLVRHLDRNAGVMDGITYIYVDGELAMKCFYVVNFDEFDVGQCLVQAVSLTFEYVPDGLVGVVKVDPEEVIVADDDWDLADELYQLVSMLLMGEEVFSIDDFEYTLQNYFWWDFKVYTLGGDLVYENSGRREFVKEY